MYYNKVIVNRLIFLSQRKRKIKLWAKGKEKKLKFIAGIWYIIAIEVEEEEVEGFCIRPCSLQRQWKDYKFVIVMCHFWRNQIQMIDNDRKVRMEKV